MKVLIIQEIVIGYESRFEVEYITDDLKNAKEYLNKLKLARAFNKYFIVKEIKNGTK